MNMDFPEIHDNAALRPHHYFDRGVSLDHHQLITESPSGAGKKMLKTIT